MANIYAVANQKGGVGKTTTAANLAAAFAGSGQRVLAVDLDPQGALSAAFGVTPNPGGTIYSCLPLAGATPRQAGEIILQVQNNLSLAPADIDLAAAELQLFSEFGRERILAQALAPCAQAFDHIIIDCPPTLSLLTVNALCAADQVLIPVATDFLALRGLDMLLDSVSRIQARLHQGLRVGGIIPTLHDTRRRLAAEALAVLQTEYWKRFRVFPPVPRRAAVEESVVAGRPAVLYAPSSPVAVAYAAIAKELMSHV